jgi:hypothetical protein
MCDPVTLAIAGATLAGGTALQSSSARSADKARQRATDADTARQNATRERARALFQSSLDRGKGLSGADTNEAAVAARKDFIDQDNSTSVDLTPGQTGATGIARRGQQVFADKAAKSDAGAGARANLEGFGDILGGNKRLNARAGSGLDILGQESRFSTDALTERLAQIDRTGGKSPLGDILVALSMATLGKAGAPAPPGTAPGGPLNILPPGFKVG